MKILLTAVNAKYIHSNLAVYSLKSSAGVYEPLVELEEYTINHRTEDMFRMIYQRRPNLLFFSCYIWNVEVISELADCISQVMPETVIWAGGPEVSYDAELFLKEHPQFTGIMCGEGENTFFSLLQYYIEEKGTLDEIPGIVYRTEDGIKASGNVPFLTSLDAVPFVYRDLKQFENRIVYYESSRGCPFSCSYCLSSIDKRVRFRSLRLVKEELTFFLQNQVKQVKFVDRTFNCSHRHAKEIWKFLSENDNGITNFHFEIAADLLDEEELEILSQMRPGLVQLEIGVQTVNEQSLAAIHRNADFEKISERVRRVASFRNIHEHLDLIAGLPYEDYESFRDSFDAVYNLHPHELQLGFLKVLKGSEMHSRASEYGIIYRRKPPYEVLQTNWISCAELLKLKEVEEMLEVYYNSRQFDRTISALEQKFERPFSLYESLAQYYKDNGLWEKAWSRQQRFEILRDFIGTVDDGPYWDELLTFDFYLRENAKSRPKWMPGQERYREWAVAFYRWEEHSHVYLPQYAEMTWKQMMRMTHLERFCYEVTGDETEKEQWLLFDYQNRDPLTYGASVCQVDKKLLSHDEERR